MLTSCSVTKFVGDDDLVLSRVKYEVEVADTTQVPREINDALASKRNYATQKPNSRILGTVRLSMRVYCLSNPNRNGFLNRYLRRTGQAPVVYDEYATMRTTQQLEGLLSQKGCFGSRVTFDTASIKGKDIAITYHIHARPRYKIDEIQYRAETEAVGNLLERWRDESPLKVGDWYDQDKIVAERSRIVEKLRNEGYFKFTNDLVRFEVDTTYAEGLLSILVDVRGTDLQVFHINNIYVYPNSNVGIADERSNYDTLIYTYPITNRTVDYQFVYAKKMTLNPQTISRALFLFPGQTYRPRNVSTTYTSLLDLQNFRYIDIEFAESPASSDSLRLVDARIRLLNSTQQKASLSLELTNSSTLGSNGTGNFITNGNFGVESAIEYQHKNLFGGAEMLKAQASLLVELPKNIISTGSGEFHNDFRAFEAGADISLSTPRLLLPFTSNLIWQRVKPHTVISLGANYQYRSYFERMVANISFGYSWNHNRTTNHQLLPVEFTYANFFNLDQNFVSRMSSLNDLRLKYLYSDHFIMDSRYDYIHTTQTVGSRTNFDYFHFQVETAGNLLSLLSHAFNGPIDDNGIRQIFEVPYSQYVRFNAEYKRYFYHGYKSAFVARALVGIGLPYANSESMPYEKSFFGGGPSTIRAWQLRYLGPGSSPRATGYAIERMGDLSLVINLEERFPIAGMFEGAVFADMGNVWLLNPSDQFPNGEFNLGRAPSEVAVGFGLGLRANISIVTLRLDVGIPLYDPGFDQALRWRPPHWQMDQLVTNIGIDYPF
ncbi:MAG: BamA/TamA family outer membrane protein [Bacteroidales bacterium]|nr:BamA/TamA family outer membrane protein [Bacteroidales bacterium]